MAERTCIYDYPQYYHQLVDWGREEEAELYDELFQHHGLARGERLLELACGTGQVAVSLAALGWEMTGLDLSPAMLEFVTASAQRAGVQVETLCTDMTRFALPAPAAGAYCPLGSIGVLPTDDLVVAHLQTVAQNLRPGGVYLVDLTLAPDGTGEYDICADWEVVRDGVRVASEEHGVVVEDGPRRLLLTWGGKLRLYSPDDFRALLPRAGAFTLEACYPEVSQDEDGLSQFAVEEPGELQPGARAIVALRREG